MCISNLNIYVCEQLVDMCYSATHLGLSTSNCIVKIITEIAICNPMPCSGDNYRELLDGKVH